MSDRLAAQGIQIRDMRWEDIPALVALRNRVQPEEPRTIEVE